jgi:hypothetical protein
VNTRNWKGMWLLLVLVVHLDACLCHLWLRISDPVYNVP